MRSFKKSPLSNRELWDQKASDWHGQVGDRGDDNRLFNSDPVLWRMLGPVDGLAVLDAGCGTGYLSRQLQAKGAQLVSVDFSPAMVELATRLAQQGGVPGDYRVDSCSSLETLPDASVDKVVSNYVLHDLPDLDGASTAFARVLRPGGVAVVLVCHPCFPQSDDTALGADGSVTYRWHASYFDEHEVEEEPWSHFSTPFLFYHRPLSGYWRSFLAAGFAVADFDEPVVSDPPPPGYDPARLPRSRMRPNSVAFLLRKPG